MANGASVVLDPWNGAGTTTTEAAHAGFVAVGIDLNPVAVLVASARLANQQDAQHLTGFVDDLLGADSDLPPNDPLLMWLDPSSAKLARSMFNRLLAALATTTDGRTLDPLRDTLPPLAAFVGLAIMRACRRMAAATTGSNPTWIRPASTPMIDGTAAFRALVRELLFEMLADLGGPSPGCATITLGDARSLALDDSSVDLVVTSPPYCTRLDYVVNTSVELALLGFGYKTAPYDALRKNMIGTPIARSRTIEAPRTEWGPGIGALLEAIRAHPSPDSGSYYYKGYWQYFADMWGSLSEVRRVLRPGAPAILVVQSSYYKEISVDLPVLLSELGEGLGFVPQLLADFPVRRVMATMNSRAKAHRASQEYREAVISLKRA